MRINFIHNLIQQKAFIYLNYISMSSSDANELSNWGNRKVYRIWRILIKERRLQRDIVNGTVSQKSTSKTNIKIQFFFKYFLVQTVTFSSKSAKLMKPEKKLLISFNLELTTYLLFFIGFSLCQSSIWNKNFFFNT